MENMENLVRVEADYLPGEIRLVVTLSHVNSRVKMVMSNTSS